MKIAISSPNIDGQTNVSGIVSVVKLIMQNSHNEYFHYLLGKPDIPMPLFKRIKTLLNQFICINKFLRTNKIDIYHQNYPFDRNGVIREAFISFLVSQTGTPILLHVHGGSYFKKQNLFMNQIARYSMRKANKIIVLSNSEKKIIDSSFGVASAILPNAVDCSLYYPQEEPIKEKTINLLYLGRIEVNKGIKELIEAVRLCKLDIRLTVCGDGPMREDIINSCTNILGDRFNYAGVVKGKEKIKIIQEQDLFILPSYFEGLPMALLETMACGVIPIASNVGSISKVVKNHINGFLLEQINGESIYRKIRQYEQLSIESKKYFKNNAVETIRKHHNQSNYNSQLNLIYRQIKPYE